MKKIRVKIKGATPLMHHRMTEEAIMALLGTKSEKKKDKETLTPREIAESHAYKNSKGEYYIPTDYIVGAFKHCASDYKQNNSVRKSIKSVASGVFRPLEDKSVLMNFKEKPIKDFEVDIKKATNHQKGAVAVCRPRFDEWQCEFTVNIDEDILTPSVAHDILNDAGKRAGIGSFRVQRGGFYGQFNVVEWKEIK